MSNKNIVAIGGGGFGRSLGELKIEKYITSLVKKEREPFVKKIIKNQKIDSCICIEGNCALHIKNDFNYESINFGNKKKCFNVFKENNKLIKEYFKSYECI